jgi:hypothetical protein
MTTSTTSIPKTAARRGDPTLRMLDAALVLAPLAYLALDCSYAARGWDDGSTASVHGLAAALYGLAALRLVILTRGRTRAVLLVIAILGIIGNAGVGDNTVHIALGGNDLFDESGPASVFKAMGFFFPLTFLVAAAVLRKQMPAWWAPLLGLGAVLFPVAHVANISWLAVVDAGIMLVALGTCAATVRGADASAPPAGFDGAV